MLQVQSKLTGQKQTIDAKDLAVIDPRGVKFRTLKEDVTPPEAKTAKAKSEPSDK